MVPDPERGGGHGCQEGRIETTFPSLSLSLPPQLRGHEAEGKWHVELGRTLSLSSSVSAPVGTGSVTWALSLPIWL